MTKSKSYVSITRNESVFQNTENVSSGVIAKALEDFRDMARRWVIEYHCIAQEYRLYHWIDQFPKGNKNSDELRKKVGGK